MARSRSAFLLFIVYLLYSVKAQAGVIISGFEEELAKKGLTVEVVETIDYFVNTTGGLKEDDTFLTNFDLTIELDTAQAGLWENGTMFVYFLENSGHDKLTGSIVGDLQTVSNIEAPRTARLYELWYEHQFFDDSMSILLGFHDYNSEFNVTEYGGLYINSSFGIQPDISLNGRPSVFPLTGPGVRLKYSPDEQWDMLLAVYDGDPGDPETSEHFPRSDLDRDGGTFIAAEAAYRLKEGRLPGFIKFGFWHNTGEFTDVAGAPVHDGNIGGYILIDKQLTRESGDTGGSGVFLQFGINDEDVNEVRTYVGTGINYQGVFPGRDEDEAGLAVAHAIINDTLTGSGSRDDHETVIELTYRAVINDSLTVQPDLQYIINPGAAAGVDDAFLAGVRVEIAL